MAYLSILSISFVHWLQHTHSLVLGSYFIISLFLTSHFIRVTQEMQLHLERQTGTNMWKELDNNKCTHQQALAGSRESRDPGILRQPKSRDFWNCNPGIFRDLLSLCFGPLGTLLRQKSAKLTKIFFTFYKGKSRPEKSRDPGISQNPGIENLDPARAWRWPLEWQWWWQQVYATRMTMRNKELKLSQFRGVKRANTTPCYTKWSRRQTIAAQKTGVSDF